MTDWHEQSTDAVLQNLQASDQGLTSDDVRRRMERYGPNVLPQYAAPSAGRILFEQFKSVVILVLVAAGVVTGFMQRWAECIAVAAVTLVNTAIGFISEWRATRSMHALRQVGRLHARVLRDGSEKRLPIRQLVPGDVITLSANELIPADARILQTSDLKVNEAALTGESVPVVKGPDPVSRDAPLAERMCMVYKSTTAAEGTAKAIIVATGSDTEVGRIAALTEHAESAGTPLEKKLDRLGRRMAVLTLILAAIIAGVGVLAGQPVNLMLETAVALGVAAIPEGLPIVATIALARGMWLMAQRNALVNRLPAVEALGATRVIFTDKTGTLTENRMRVRRLITALGQHELEPDTRTNRPDDSENQPQGINRRLVEIGALCNDVHVASTDADTQARHAGGDPMEVALLDAARKSGIDVDELRHLRRRIDHIPFDRETMMMATLHDTNDGVCVAVKGAPERVIDASKTAAGVQNDTQMNDHARKYWKGKADELAGQGMRVLAVAEKFADSTDVEPYTDLRFIGLIGLADPPRPGVRAAIDQCQSAGIRPVLVTGDQPATAMAIAEQVGMIGQPEDEDARLVRGTQLSDLDELDQDARRRIHHANIFARVTPEQKLNLVTVYQDFGDTVAMTGDGVNDTPALKKADIGVAMGNRGTDAAKQVADMVLKDDAFETIVEAVRQGRIIFGNIRKSVIFMLCTNAAEVLAVALASLAGVPLPLRPLQILYLNVLTDVLPALALGVGDGPGDIMKQPPRRTTDAMLSAAHWRAIVGWAVLIAACVLAALGIGHGALDKPESEAVTMSFLTLALAKMWFVFNLRESNTSIIRNEITRNRWIWRSLALCAALVVAAVYLPGLSDILRTRPPGITGWFVVVGLSLIPVAAGQLRHAWHARTSADSVTEN